MIETAGVVVPAHNEETLLPACLSALRRAARQVSVPVHLLVAADSCTDRTAAVARAYGARVIRIRARSVGAARAAGMTELLRLTAGWIRPRCGWRPPTPTPWCRPTGSRRQLSHAGRGWDVVPRDGQRGGLERASAARAGCIRGPLRVRRSPAPARPRGEHRHPRLGLPGRGRLPATADGRRPGPARRRGRGGLLGPACRRRHGGDLGRRHARAPHGFSHLLRALASPAR